MCNRKKKLWIPNSVRKIESIIVLFLETHPVGLAVLSGKYEYPNEDEIHEMFSCFNIHDTLGVRIKGGESVYQAQKRIEQIESEVSSLKILSKYGGKERMAEVFCEYEENNPESFKILKEISNIGKPSGKTMSALSEEFKLDIKTLKKKRKQTIEEIAMRVVFYGEDSAYF